MDRQTKAAYAVLIIVTLSVAGMLAVTVANLGYQVPERTVGDLTVSGTVAGDGVDLDEYGGVATLTYTGGGDRVEWRLRDNGMPAYVKVDDSSYSLRGYDQTVSGRTLTLEDPGRYRIQLVSDGNIVRTGTATLDGTVTRHFEWTQVISQTVSYDYSVDLSFPLSAYLGYVDADAVRHSDPTLEDSRFAAVDGSLRMVESALRDEYDARHGPSVLTQDYADYLLSFVQCCIAYPDPISRDGSGTVTADPDGYGDLYLYGSEEYWAYPLETIYRGMGDCEDTSFLTAALYAAAGFDSAVASLPNHMVAAVHLEDFAPRSIPGYLLAVKTTTSTHENYYFCETTTSAFLAVGYVDVEVHAYIHMLDSISLVAVAS